ncbi:rhodanese-like domain-containing protein [Flavimarina sp. Hel_I_48]|uniref:rhodanese-like domain-containing protein n=1 Tax=Flavimarina sp. Hel_I_48 TaxID=1392488 RepID=UPI00056CB481|nr:rhodanese-like domain-containing protein [Flavimarina sp. Hel_I_48]
MIVSPQKFSSLLFTIPFLFGFIKSLHAQQSIDDILKKYNTQSVPYISVETLKMEKDNYVLLDTRKKEEYDVSHLAEAIWVGEHFDAARIESLQLKKEQPIVVYCTVGVRSESYGERLKNSGFTDINNLYGSIFAWKNAGFPIVDLTGRETEKVHVYSKIWGKYLKNGEKIY